MENITINTSSYKEAINQEKEFYVQFRQYTPEAEIVLLKSIHRILAKYDLLYYKETIFAIIKELVNNSIKANMKRLYFNLNQLNIADPADYEKGMGTFKADTYEDPAAGYFEKLINSSYVVRVIFKPAEGFYRFIVVNNTPILDLELKKIESRLKKAWKYADMSEAFDDVLDDSEGAGLGLIMAMMVMKNSGMPADSFRISRKSNLTISTVKISLASERNKIKSEIAEEILSEIKAIPAFPENIKQIELMCGNPDVDMREIANVISRDPGLTTTILKLANSAGYFVPKKIESIAEAVKIIGINGIKTLLIATGARKVLDTRYKQYDSIWKTSYKRASYAQKIAIQLKMNRIGDMAYLSALLADVGRIILLSINPETIAKLKAITGIDDIAESTLIEEITIGISHTSLGGMVCAGWGFDQALISAIEYHHSPHLADDKLKPLIYSVYLADMLIDLENKRIHPQLIDEDVIDFMHLGTSAEFENLHFALKESYAIQTESGHA